MTSTYTTNLRFVQQADGDNSNTWGDVFNAGMTALADQAIAGVTALVMTDTNHTLVYTNGASDEARSAVLEVTSSVSLTATRAIIAPASTTKTYIVNNLTSGGQAITIGYASGSVVTVPNGVSVSVYGDGTNFYPSTNYIASPVFGSLTVNGTSALNGVVNVSGALTATGGIAGVTIIGQGWGSRVYADTTNTAGILQFTNNNGSSQWAALNVGSSLATWVGNYSVSGNFTASGTAIITGTVTGGSFSGPLTGNVTGSISGGSVAATSLTANSVTVAGASDSTTVGGVGVRVRADSGNTSAILQFTNNSAGVQWGAFTATNGALTWTGSFSPNSYLNLPTASTGTQGISALASGSQVITGTDTTHAVTPASLTSAQSSTANGYFTLPGGTIYQWGSATVTNNSSATVVLSGNNITFPNNCWNVQITQGVQPSSVQGSNAVTGLGTTGFTIRNNSNATGTFYWVAIGN